MKLSNETFIERANKRHSNKYDYSETIYNGGKNKIKIICPIHGHFLQTPQTHINGCGCPECRYVKSAASNSKTLRKFIEDSVKIHGNRYDYSAVIYKNDRSDVIVICNTHGKFFITPNNHLSGQGCCPCGEEIARKKITRTLAEFLLEAFKIHGNRYDYANVEHSTGYDKVSILCYKHGEFLQVANTHLYGRGCPKCSSSISKLEIKWLESLGVPDTKENRQVKIQIGEKYIKVDGYIPETNTIYEFWGDYWHGNPDIFSPDDMNTRNKKTFGKLYEETQRKRKLIIAAGFNLVEIWENEFSMLSTKLRVLNDN